VPPVLLRVQPDLPRRPGGVLRDFLRQPLRAGAARTPKDIHVVFSLLSPVQPPLRTVRHLLLLHRPTLARSGGQARLAHPRSVRLTLHHLGIHFLDLHWMSCGLHFVLESCQHEQLREVLTYLIVGILFEFQSMKYLLKFFW